MQTLNRFFTADWHLFHNVGVDAWDLKPVSFDQILELLKEHKIL